MPGSLGHEVQDAQTYGQWGIDYLKYEGCSFPDPLAHELEKAVQMRDALQATLQKEKIGCAVYYPLPLHLQTCFAYVGGKAGDHPHSERACHPGSNS